MHQSTCDKLVKSQSSDLLLSALLVPPTLHLLEAVQHYCGVNAFPTKPLESIMLSCLGLEQNSR
jgi:hypothetical protein